MTNLPVLVHEVVTGKLATAFFTRKKLYIEIFRFGLGIFWNNSNTTSSTATATTPSTTSASSSKNIRSFTATGINTTTKTCWVGSSRGYVHGYWVQMALLVLLITEQTFKALVAIDAQVTFMSCNSGWCGGIGGCRTTCLFGHTTGLFKELKPRVT